MTRKTLWRPCSGLAIACLAVLGLNTMNNAVPVSMNNVLPLAEVAADPHVRQVAAANTDFGFRLLKKLDQEPRGNVFFSPFSVSNALTMVLNGAGGGTGRDIASALALGSLTPDQINQANGLLLPSLSRPDPKVELSVANALWANAGITFSPDFERKCRQFYGARAATLDFSSPASADTINGWVSGNTHGKITRLVSHKDIVAASAVLTNAVYFHGLWQTPFDKAGTHDAPFTLAGGVVKMVPLMEQSGSLLYLDTPDFQAVSLPYGQGRLSLYVFLPKPGVRLDAFVGALDAKKWNGWVGAMRPTRMTLLLPRFKADYRAILNPALINLGMGSAFSPDADFRPMGLGGLFIGAVIHKAVLEVDEEGTVAAAATAVIMVRSARPGPQVLMRVDRPFFCAIRDNATGTLLFAGVIRDPR